MTDTPRRPHGDPRLEAVASLVPRRSRVAEVGTDHGQLPRRLLQSGRAEFYVATERTEPAVARLRAAFEGERFADDLELRVGDGLAPLGPEDDIWVLILAGLGAHKILRILGETGDLASLGVARLVLQPQSEPPRVRRWLTDHRWRIVEERIAEERGQVYVALAAEPARGDPLPSHPELDAEDLIEAGPCLVRSTDPLVRQVWSDREQLYREVARKAGTDAARDHARRRRDQAARILAALPG